MKENVYYIMQHASLAERESFNSSILLLSMVRSEFYYIVGFSRQNGLIEIAFDHTGEHFGQMTEHANIDYISSPENIVMTSRLCGLNADMFSADAAERLIYGCVKTDENEIIYTMNIPKDEVIPISASQMNNHIMIAKREICMFIDQCYNDYLDS